MEHENNDQLEQNTQEVQEEVEETQEQSTQASSPTPQESFRQLREKAERAERERDEMRQALQQVYMNQQKQAQPQEEDDPSELIERRHLKRYDSELERVRKELQYTRQTISEQRLKAAYPDFDKVVNEKTINQFREKNPGLAASLAATEDLYEKGSAVYSLIKNMGIYQEDNYGPDRQRAEQNANKPKPTNAVSPQRGESPLSHANAFAQGLTDDLKQKLYAEMEAARKGSW